MQIDSSHQYRQDEIPSEIFNSSNGDIKNFNGQAVQVSVNNNGTRSLSPMGDWNGYQAQQQYKQATQKAITGLQGQQSSLGDQYKTLLNDVLGQGTVAMNTITTGENNLLGQRGITNDSPLYSREMGMAQLPVQQANQAAVGSLGFTEGQLQNDLATNIANLSAGAAGTQASLPLQFGSLALSQAANVANIGLAGAQTRASNLVPIPGYGVYDTVSKQLIGGLNGVGNQGVTNINGVPSLYIP